MGVLLFVATASQMTQALCGVPDYLGIFWTLIWGKTPYGAGAVSIGTVH